MTGFIRRTLGVAALVLVLPAAAWAQASASITGVVKDASGAVLPGVTVEAMSPQLIEKVRSAITDGTGQYRIVNLPPGTYAVTFTLTGFSTVQRDGVQLSGAFVATVNADMKVGAVAETITVSSESPVVDLQNIKAERIVSKDVLEAIPTARTAQSLQLLIPGIASTRGLDVGGALGSFGGGDAGTIHGGRTGDSRTMNDGLTTNSYGGNGGGQNLANIAGAQEVVITTSGGLAEAQTSGLVVNIIPRDGANTFSGMFFANGATGDMQGSNYTQSLISQGLKAPSQLLHVFDVNAMGGGRIVRDRLWFYLTERDWGAHNTVPGMFLNKNAGNPNAWTYVPDPNQQAFLDNISRTHIGRLTWQATPRNKINGYWAENYNCMACSGGGTATQAVESTTSFEFSPSRVLQSTWSSPISNRLLAEAGVGTATATLDTSQRHDGTFNPQLIQVVEQGGSIPGLTYRAQQPFNLQYVATYTWRASLSYVTGAHSAKFGYFGGLNNPPYGLFYYGPIIQMRFNNGVPNQLTETGTYPGMTEYNRSLHNTSLYAQDVWTHGRLTLQGGVRYDHEMINYPEQVAGGTLIIPQRIVFPASQGANWNDITPRVGAAYDLRGNGKTAVKVSLGKYIQSVLISPQGNDFDLNPLTSIALNTTRSWTPSLPVGSANYYVPQCDLTNPNANGDCGPMANKSLGTTQVNRTWDPAWYTGWGNAPYNWEFSASVQQQVSSRASITVGYFRRWFGNWYTVQNLATATSDYTQFGLSAPLDPRLPGGGGQTISGLYNVNPNKFGLIDEYATSANNFGGQTENWQGLDVTYSMRVRQGLTLQAATSSGRIYTDNCALRAQLPELGSTGVPAGQTLVSFTPTFINSVSLTNPYCRVVQPFFTLTHVAGFASYLIPKIDVQVSGTFQSNPGPELGATWNAPNSIVKASLGRDLSGGAANIPVPVIAPATMYGARINELDFRASKIMHFKGLKTQFMVDVYNLTNTDTPLTYNNTFVPGGSWLTPTSVMVARFAKVGVQVDF